MAKGVIRLGRANTGLTLADMTVDFCKRILDGAVVSLDGMTMRHDGVGIYVLDNPNVTGDTVISLYKTSDSSVEGVTILSPADGAILTGGGANQITLKTHLADLAPIPDVSIQVFNSDQTVLICAGVTNAAGEKVLALNDGTYKVRLYKAGYTFTTPETIVVSGNGTFTLTGAAVQIGQPASVNTCRVYEWCFMADDSTPKGSVTAKANIINTPYDYNGKLHAGDVINGIYDPVSGKVYWDIVYGALVEFKIAEMDVDVKKTVPSVTDKRLSDIV